MGSHLKGTLRGHVWCGPHNKSLRDPSVLNNLMFLKLRGCGNCSTLPPVGQLTHLKCLEISIMARLEHVGSEFYGTAFFQSLEKLSFEDMPNWEKWLYCAELFPYLEIFQYKSVPSLLGNYQNIFLHWRNLKLMHVLICLRLRSLFLPFVN